MCYYIGVEREHICVEERKNRGKRKVGQNCCPLITHAKWAERMRRNKNVLKLWKKWNKFRKFNQTKQQREYSLTGRALALQARGSGIETLCFHFLFKKK